MAVANGAGELTEGRGGAVDDTRSTTVNVGSFGTLEG